ncbi:CHASE2 domain-containing protein, partial [Candidatus Marithioploca araucensis]|nr:CHASE2 domain-containing protein [Candidatus Marithioploca araucensis]
LMTNIAIGLIVLVFLTFFQKYPWMMDAEDANLDFAMQVRQDTIPPAKEKGIPPFVFLDIDEQTHKMWGEPLFTPRDKVKQLIDFAVKGGARLVIVDVDLSQKTPIEGLPLDGLQQHPYDQELQEYIAGYKNQCEKSTGCPSIILARVFRPLSGLVEEDEKFSDWFRPEPEPIRKARTGFLEEAVKNSAPYVQWASPLFLQSSFDNVVRRWWLWQPICTEEKPEVIPSIQLLAAAMIRLETPQQAQDKIKTELSRFKPELCTDNYIPLSESSKPIKIAEGLEITEGMHGIRQRILYNMPWNPPQNIGDGKFTVRYFLQDYDEETQEREVILTVFSAQPYLDSPQANAAGVLKDKIVLIGGSYSNGGDLHATPLETMPGGLIIINAIHTLLQHGEIEPLSGWDNLWLTALFILIVSLIFSLSNSFWIVILSGTVVVGLIPVSVLLLGEGVWVNFALPLLAVHVHQIAANYQQMSKELEEPQQKASSSVKLAREIEQSLIRTLSKQIHEQVNEVLMNNLSKTMEQSKQLEKELTTVKIPPTLKMSSTTPNSEEVSKQQQDEAIVVDKQTTLEPSNKITQNSEEVSKQQQDTT